LTTALSAFKTLVLYNAISTVQQSDILHLRHGSKQIDMQIRRNNCGRCWN